MKSLGKTLVFSFLIGATFFQGSATSAEPVSKAKIKAPKGNVMSVYDFKAKSIDGKQVALSDYNEKVLLIVNVASKCGNTPQYAGLEALYEKYKDKGLVVLGFPCNKFGAQEPGTEPEIKSFCETNYKVTFPLFSKIDVNGANTHPLYQFLKKGKDIGWNFSKFLIDRKGHLIQRYEPSAKPDTFEKDIEKSLSAKAK